MNHGKLEVKSVSKKWVSPLIQTIQNIFLDIEISNLYVSNLYGKKLRPIGFEPIPKV